MNLREDIIAKIEDIKSILNLNGDMATLDLIKLSEISPEITNEIYNMPKYVLDNIRNELHSISIKELRLINCHNKKEIKELRAKDLNTFISLKGVIKRITKVMPKIESLKFECPGCGNISTIPQGAKKTKITPKRCSCGRTGGFMEIGKNIIDIQEINLESLPEVSDGQPQQIRVLLKDKLVDTTLNSNLRPGKRVEIVGLIDEMPGFMSNKSEDSILSEFMLHANNILSLEESSEVHVTEEDEKQIKEILKENPLQTLCDSLAPEIHGYDEIKKALILQMIKGVNKERSDGSKSRGDIHILLAGDPGVAKSRLAGFAEKKSPGSKTIIGTRTSKASLGAMAVKDELTGYWALEIGPLVQCNNSVLYLDELDKMNKEGVNELLEPLSSGQVTVNKAGISARLPSQTSVCAIANPKKGNYDLEQPLARQIDIPSPIINRFDLIFVMVDKPDTKIDSNSIDHVFNSFIQKRESKIDVSMFKKIISYCRKLRPVLTPEIIEYLKPLYVNLRKQSDREKSNAIPINLRNIEGIIRLSEAHAKLRLSDKVEKVDFEEARKIFMYCLKQIGIENEIGMIDMSRTTEKIPTSHRSRKMKILEIINELKDDTNNFIGEHLIYDKAGKFNIERYEVTTFLNELRNDGEILSPRRGIYQIL